MNEHTEKELTDLLSTTAQNLYREALRRWEANGWSIHTWGPTVEPSPNGKHAGEVKYTMTKEGKNPAEAYGIFEYIPSTAAASGRWFETRQYRLRADLD
ncbi:hypothetical protein [Variovorax paradoxus]|uniref:hypothetical protein n=1 Tax=Variovorax paradoxus TaxID=34073 RepID=UPI003D64FF70